MAHSENIISSIKLPNGTTYEIHDANAIHDVSELGLSAALVFKGTKETYSLLPTTGNKVGDVWLVTATSQEYVWTDKGNWEALGGIHDAASSTHTHNVYVTGKNIASQVTGNVVIPTITTTSSYLYATSQPPSIKETTDSVLGANTTFSVSGGSATTTKLKASASGVAVAGNGTTSAITGFGTHTTAKAITELNTSSINNPTVTAGTAAKLEPTVVNGVLSFGFTANTPTVVTTTPVTVATGSKTTANAITALGTPTTATALTGVKVTSQPTVTLSSGATGDVSVATDVSAITVTASGDEVNAITEIKAYSPSVSLISAASLPEGAEGYVSAVTRAEIGTANSPIVDGVAKAQVWESESASTSAPKN